MSLTGVLAEEDREIREWFQQSENILENSSGDIRMLTGGQNAISSFVHLMMMTLPFTIFRKEWS